MDLCADLIMLHAEWNLADMLICEDILHITSWTSHCRRFFKYLEHKRYRIHIYSRCGVHMLWLCP
jgi:hypothetical protein